jgi:hypothetical protein
MKVKLNNLEVGAKWFGEYAQPDSDKTANTGFVGFGSTFLWGCQDLLANISVLYRARGPLSRG